MIGNKRILGLIPARGGSKGIPGKNLCDIGGKPLIGWAIDEGKKSKYIDTLIVSTDDAEIAHVAKEHGGDVPFLRPAAISGDDALTIDVALHALESLPGHDLVVLLQPTSPLRLVEDIDGCLEFFAQAGTESCASVSLSSDNPCWMFNLAGEDLKLIPILDEMCNLKQRRQDTPDFYVLNGAVYVASTQWLMQKKLFVAEGTIGYPMPRTRAVDIDDWPDLEIARLLMEKNGQLSANSTKTNF